MHPGETFASLATSQACDATLWLATRAPSAEGTAGLRQSPARCSQVGRCAAATCVEHAAAPARLAAA